MRHFVRGALLCAAVTVMGAGSATSQPRDQLAVFAAGASGASAPLRSINVPVAVRDVAVNSHGMIFLTDPAKDQLLEYSATASGDAAPVETLGGHNTRIVSPSALAFDERGALYVANEGRSGDGASITVYAAGATGDMAPDRTVEGTQTALTDPTAIAVDSRGEIYAVDAATSAVLVFSPGASGDQAPTRRLTVSGFTARFLAIGRDDVVYVFESDGPHGAEEIVAFPHGSSTPDPARAPIVAPGVAGAEWMSVDDAGQLSVISPGRVVTFAPSASGNARPLNSLDVNFFLSNCCARMAAGADGTLYVYLTLFHWAG